MPRVRRSSLSALSVLAGVLIVLGLGGAGAALGMGEHLPQVGRAPVASVAAGRASLPLHSGQRRSARLQRAAGGPGGPGDGPGKVPAGGAKAAAAPAAGGFAVGDLFVGGGSGTGTVNRYSENGTLLQTLDTGTGGYEAGMCFDSAGNMYQANFTAASMTEFDSSGNVVTNPWGGPWNGQPESCALDQTGNMYVGSVGPGDLRKFDRNGHLLATYTPAIEDRGIDWIALASDQCTIYYSSEGSSIKRFNVCTNSQLADFATGLPAPCYTIRFRADGEVMVACSTEVVRFSASGSILQTYTLASLGESTSPLYGLSLDPDGSTFWTGDYNTGDVIHVDIASGNVLTKFNDPQVPFGMGQYPGAGPGTGEQGGPPNPTENPVTISAGCPVNCATGVFWHQWDDLTVPGRGVPLDFQRTYSSQAATIDGPLGFGWTDCYNMSLSFDQAGDVTVQQEDGSTVTFGQNGSGGYVAAPRVLATLVKNGDGTYTFTRNADLIHYTFSSTGQLLKEVDRNGYTTSLSYNGSQLTSVTDPAGRTFTFAYSGSHIASVTGPGPRTESFAYDGDGNLQTATDPANETWTFSYDSNHQLLTMKDPNGGLTTNVYDGSGRVTSQTDPMNRKTTWSYSGDPTSAAGGTTTVTDPNGNQTTLNFQNLELISKTDAAGTSIAATTTYIYDPATLGVTSLTDPNNHTSTATYDAHGNQTSFTDPLNRVTTATYNALDEPLTVKDPSGVTTTRSYDSNGNLLTVSRPLNGSQTATTSFHYDDPSHPGDITSTIDADGHSTSFGYDNQGDVVAITNAVGDTATFTYNSLGERTSMVSPRGNITGGKPAEYTTSYTYDALGRLRQTTDPLGHIVSRTFDSDGNVTTSTDSKNNPTSYTYDLDNELTKITRADTTTLTYGYDGDGNQTSQSDGANHTTSYGYDALDRVSSMTDPLNRTTGYGYDGAGNLTSLTNPTGQKTSYGYDAANELTSISYSDGTTPNVSFTYTPNGLRATMVDGTGKTTYGYDQLNRLSSQTNGAGQIVSYGYDLNGNLTSLTYPNGKTVTRSYDNANQLNGITDWLNHTTNFTVDADSNTTTIAYANGITASNLFDQADQVSSITDKTSGGSTIASFTYTRDANGQLTSTTPTGSGQGSSETYGYNSLNQLTAVNSSSYGYDAADNITKLTNGATLGYDAANEVTSYTPSGGSATSLSYDQQGNRLTGLNGASYSYDQANRLIAATGSGGKVGLLAAGQYHSLAVKSDGTVWAWGYNNDGELGDGTTTERLTPVQVSGLSGARSVAAGLIHSMALMSDGTVKSWGANVDGQLGDGTTTSRLTPVSVSGLSGVVAIGAGNDHSLAVKSDGTVWAWGYNSAGELGDGTTSNRLTPVQASGLTGVIQVAGGGMPGYPGHSAALKSDGTVWTWGYNKHGQLGLGNTTNQATPQQVPGLSNVVQIAAGGDNTYALKSDGTVWAWGDNSYKQLGNTSVRSQSTTPVQVNISGVAQISAGATDVLALKTDGTAWGWGNDNTYELGDGGACGKTCVTPVQITGLGSNASLLLGGWIHSLAAMNDGTVKGWGGNNYGQIGDGTTAVRTTPVNTQNLTGIKSTTFAATYDGDGLRATATGPAGATLHFAWDLSAGVPLMLTDGSTNYIYDDSGLPVEQIDSSGTPFYYQHDQLGSTRLLTDESGSAAATYTYDAYGNVTSHTGAADSPLRWNGQYQDVIGLYYLRARYYDAQTGLFLTRDPASASTQEPYAYTADNPLSEEDPSGLCESAQSSCGAKYYGYSPRLYSSAAEVAGDTSPGEGPGAIALVKDSWSAAANVFVTGVRSGPITCAWTVSFDLIYDSSNLGALETTGDLVAEFGYSFGFGSAIGVVTRPTGRGPYTTTIEHARKWPAVLTFTYHTTLEYEFYPSNFLFEIGIVTHPAGGEVPLGQQIFAGTLSRWTGPRLAPAP